MTEETREERIRYETPGEGIVRIVLARPEARNAQDKPMLFQLDAALRRAAHDTGVKVIIIAAEGPHFSAGHDLRDTTRTSDFEPTSMWGGTDLPGAEGPFASEQEIYLGLCWRWRNLPKPTIVEVHGKVIAGGLMLVWPFDIVIASEEAEFSDPVVAFGVNGHEYFTHVWEVGHRMAREMLFTGRALSAEEGFRLGMVNRVVERDQLEAEALTVAERICKRPSMGLMLAKQAINQSLDAQGQWTALNAAFGLHHLGHSHSAELHGMRVDPSGVDTIRSEAKKTKDD